MNICSDINIGLDKLSSGLSEALKVCSWVSKSPDAEDVLDFSLTTFITPAFVIPLTIFLKSQVKDIAVCNLSDYLRLIHFDTLGADSGTMRKAEFSAFMEKFSRKNYIPIIKFPATKERIEDKDNILSSIEKIMVSQTGLDANIVTGIKYMLAEIVDNITEHSHSPNGYIFAQCYPSKGFIDICIGDNGVTLLGSYKRREDCEIFSDEEAMRAANSGISTKNLPDAENRGYGLKTSRNMLIDGLGGQYIMVSGDTVYGKTPVAEGYVELPTGIRFEGTIVAMRIPYHDNSQFHYIKYIE